jgi:hypothetical protein
MRRRHLGLSIAALLVLSACGGGDSGVGHPPPDSNAPVLQVRSEGGFVPVEWNFGRGPTYTLTADGSLIYEGPVIEIYPGPLLPNYQVVSLDQGRVDHIHSLIDEMGLSSMGEERDDSAFDHVADATTEVFTYWDDSGQEHIYSVYALGIDSDSSNPATAVALDLMDALSEASTVGPSEPYTGDRVRVVAGTSQSVTDPDFEDIRDWPLAGEDPAQWTALDLGFTCKVFGPEVLETFTDATQVTQWTHPDPTMDAPVYMLLVRPLHPGEPDCQTAG